MFIIKKLSLAFLLLVSLTALGQKGIIRGTVIDDATGETLIGVAVIIDGTTIGASTDLDGKFEIKAAPGTYTISASFISFATLKVEGVEVKADEVNNLGTLRLGSDVEQLQEVVVTAKAVRNTEAALMTMKKKSVNVIDGVSAAAFKKVGDSDAAGAMSRVTGVSVEGGKYVYVRGLGDRYTKTQLNGIDVPGLDPDKNTVQMDIFPTNIIDNIVVSKNFTADLPADFTGGAVNIELKDFPEEKSAVIGAGVGYNPAMHFNENYVTYNGGNTDFLGFDDGTRDIPTGGSTDLPSFNEARRNPNGSDAVEYREILQGFNKQMAGYRAMSGMNSSMNFSYGNQIGRGDKTIGYSFALTYKNDIEYYEDAEFNLYGKQIGATDYELTALETQKGDFGVNNVLVGGMAGFAIKSDDSKLRVNLLHLQNGESKAGQFDFVSDNFGAEFNAKQDNLEYSERGLTNILINGTKEYTDRGLRLDWKVSPTRSTIEDPDVRFTRIRDEGRGIGTEAGLPMRIWRSLEEYNLANKVDFTKDLKINGKDSKVKFGLNATVKNRDFNIQGFQINAQDVDFNGQYENPSPNDIFREENLWSSENPNGVRFNAPFVGNNPNKYNSSIIQSAAYVSTEYSITPLLKTVVGVRMESFEQYYTGSNQSGDKFNNENVLSNLDLFPTANFIYSLTEKQNLRFSYAKTIARPSFKEMSYATIADPITGRTFVGGLFQETGLIGGENVTLWDGNLRSTRIHNLDVRWELFQDLGQTFSVSGFYKYFNAPIEMVQFLSQPGTFQARNVGNAQLFGMEFELVQSLATLSEKLEKFTFNANLTLVKSSIEMSGSELASRRSSAKEGEVVGTKRAMAGQAPIIVNTGLSYTDREKGFTANVSYNVQGRTLQFVGFGKQTDVYAIPFHNLSFKLSQAFGKDKRLSGSFKVNNILNDTKEQVFSAYRASDQIFQSLRPARTFSLGFSYKLY